MLSTTEAVKRWILGIDASRHAYAAIRFDKCELEVITNALACVWEPFPLPHRHVSGCASYLRSFETFFRVNRWGFGRRFAANGDKIDSLWYMACPNLHGGAVLKNDFTVEDVTDVCNWWADCYRAYRIGYRDRFRPYYRETAKKALERELATYEN